MKLKTAITILSGCLIIFLFIMLPVFLSMKEQKELELEQYGMVSDAEDKTLGDAASDGYNSDIDRVAYANPVSGRAEQTQGWRYHDSTGHALKNR